MTQLPGCGLGRGREFRIVEPDRRPILADFDGRQGDPAVLDGSEPADERLAAPRKDQEDGVGPAASDELDRERVFLGKQIGEFQDRRGSAVGDEAAVLRGPRALDGVDRRIDEPKKIDLRSSRQRREGRGFRRGRNADVDEENRRRDESRENGRRDAEEEGLGGYRATFQSSTPEMLA